MFSLFKRAKRDTVLKTPEWFVLCAIKNYEIKGLRELSPGAFEAAVEAINAAGGLKDQDAAIEACSIALRRHSHEHLDHTDAKAEN